MTVRKLKTPLRNGCFAFHQRGQVVSCLYDKTAPGEQCATQTPRSPAHPTAILVVATLAVATVAVRCWPAL